MKPDRGQFAGLLADLNEPQRRAVTHGAGPLLVIAGPGSGKTRVITRRAAYLVHSGVPAGSIVAITFTNKAADEMRRRIEALGVARGMWVYTFHALGVRLLREFGALAGVAPGFSIYDEADSQRVVKEALEVADVSPGVLSPEVARARISRAKNRLETAQDCLARARRSDELLVARVYEAYQALLEQRNAVDFDDLLLRVALVLRDHPDVRERLNIRFRHLLIDEYQDTNHAQYRIARYLSEHHRNICATGDPDQSIYGWRGADLRNILEFEQDYPDAVVVRLEQNYRSTGCILRAAARLIRANRRRRHKELWTAAGDGAPVRIWQFARDRDEAEQIAARIAALHAGGRPYHDFAIMYRINAVSRGLEDALRQRGIPYRVARGVEFYNRREIRDVLAYLRVLVNPADEVALLRIINTPPRGIGPTTVERLQIHARQTGRPLREVLARAAEVPDLRSTARRVQDFAALLDRLQPVLTLPVAEAVSAVLRASGLEEALRAEQEEGGEDRLANVQELVTAAARYQQEQPEPSLADFLSRTALVNDQDALDEHAGFVMLLTLHAAKGLEFPFVFLVGLEQGLLPHERALAADDLEEERRLCFVGCTRAREELCLSFAAERVIRGRPTPRSRSQFIVELDEPGTAWEHFGLQPAGPRPEGFVPLVDDLPPEEAARLVPRRRLRSGTGDGEADAGPQPPAREPRPAPAAAAAPAAPDAPPGPYADWCPGTLVQHARFGVGQILWVRATPGRTRAGVRFPAYGEKTLVLEYTPIKRLERGPR